MSLFYRNRQLLLLTITLVVVWGLSALATLPRMEDPLITQRNAQVVTALPGASPERVESLVTEPLEEVLFEIEEIATLDSTSSQGLSVVAIELKETVRDVDPVWSRIRDAIPELPPEASDPEYQDNNVTASALIVGLTWQLPTAPNYAILNRLADGLVDELRAIPGTDTVERFGNPDEEIQVTIAADRLARLGLTAPALSQQIAASDAKVSAGELRSDRDELLLEVASELATSNSSS